MNEGGGGRLERRGRGQQERGCPLSLPLPPTDELEKQLLTCQWSRLTGADGVGASDWIWCFSEPLAERHWVPVLQNARVVQVDPLSSGAEILVRDSSRPPGMKQQQTRLAQHISRTCSVSL